MTDKREEMIIECDYVCYDTNHEANFIIGDNRHSILYVRNIVMVQEINE